MMVLRVIAGVTLLLSTLCVSAQHNPEPLGARAGAMAYASVTLQDAWAMANNQAGIAQMDEVTATAFYRNRFFVEGLDYQGIGVAYPTSSGVFALNVVSDGNEFYRESRFGLAYGRQLSDILDMGVQVNYHGTRLKSSIYGSSSAVTAEVGVRAQLTDELALAAHIFNPTRSFVIEEPPERISTRLRFGAEYRVSEKAMVIGEVSKDIEAETVVRLGLEYMPLDNVYLRAGVGTEPVLTSFGIGMEVSALKLDVGAGYNNDLGYVTTINIAYAFGTVAKDD